jgi:hypothetical protein
MNSQGLLFGALIVIGLIATVYCGFNIWQFFSLQEKVTKDYAKFITDAEGLSFYATQFRREINSVVFGGEDKIKELEESTRTFKSSLDNISKKKIDPKEILLISEKMISLILVVSLSSSVYTTTYSDEKTGLLISESFLKQVGVARDSITKLSEVFLQFTYIRRSFPLSLLPVS